MKKFTCYMILILALVSRIFAVQLMIRPQEAKVEPGAGFKFEIALFNDSEPLPLPSTGLNWQVIPESLGKITDDGYFIAGREPGVGAILATLIVGQETFLAKAQVTVGKPAAEMIQIIIKPEKAIIAPNDKQLFTVYAYGADGVALQTQSIRWLVEPGSLGVIRANGEFTAGSRNGEGKIIAAIEYKDRLYRGSAAVVVSAPAKSAIYGTVLDDAGAILANASISASRVGWPSFSQKTKSDEKGAYLLGRLIPGRYIVSAETAGYLPEYYNNATNLLSAQPVQLAVSDTATAIDFSLSKGGVITGLVASADNTPLAGAHVYASVLLRGSTKFHSVTDNDGLYKLEGLAAGSYIVYAQKEGYLTEIYKEVKNQSEAVPVQVTPPATTDQINFTLDVTSAITGIISNEKDGTPIAGAMVYIQTLLTDQNHRNKLRGSAKTDEQGRYIIQVVPGIYLVHATARGFAEEYYDQVQDPLQATAINVTAAEHVQVDMALTALGTLSGLVTDALTGLPLADAKIRIFNERKHEKRYFETLSGADGKYSFIALPEDDYVVQADADGYLTEYWQEADSLQNALHVAVKNGVDVKDINLTLSIGATLKGHVMAADAAPIKEALVTVFAVNGRSKRITKSQADGSWETRGLDPGKYVAMAVAPGYVMQWYNGVAVKQEATVLEVAAAEVKEGIDFALAKIVLEGATISGLVHDDSTGLPLPNVTLTAMPLGRLGKPRRAVSDNEGKFQIAGIGAGTYVLTAALKGYIAEYYDNTTSWRKAKSLRVAATDNLTEMNFGLAPQKRGGYMISGRVKAGNGEASAYALVNIAVDDQVVAATVCEEDGQYALTELPADGYQVTASIPGFADSSVPSNTPVTVGYGKNEYAAQITMVEEATTGVVINTAMPQQFSLEQNYPNPFNPTTEIHFTLAEQAHIRLQVYNLLGQVVRTLYEGVYSAGAYQTGWDGFDNNGQRMASGIYLYRLQAISGDRSFDQTRRMIMMK